jgi:hypothetical protein
MYANLRLIGYFTRTHCSAPILQLCTAKLQETATGRAQSEARRRSEKHNKTPLISLIPLIYIIKISEICGIRGIKIVMSLTSDCTQTGLICSLLLDILGAGKGMLSGGAQCEN